MCKVYKNVIKVILLSCFLLANNGLFAMEDTDNIIPNGINNDLQNRMVAFEKAYNEAFEAVDLGSKISRAFGRYMSFYNFLQLCFMLSYLTEFSIKVQEKSKIKNFLNFYFSELEFFLKADKVGFINFTKEEMFLTKQMYMKKLKFLARKINEEVYVPMLLNGGENQGFVDLNKKEVYLKAKQQAD